VGGAPESEDLAKSKEQRAHPDGEEEEEEDGRGRPDGCRESWEARDEKKRERVSAMYTMCVDGHQGRWLGQVITYSQPKNRRI